MEGGTVVLQLSRGPARRVVPDLTGLTREQATAALDDAGLAAGAVTSAFSAAPVGTVVRSDPAVRASLPAGTAVALVLSKGVELLGVPDVQGARRADAERALTDAGLTPVVTEVFSDGVAKGRVADQSRRRAARPEARR